MTTSSCPGLGHHQEEDEGITMIGVGGVKVALGPLSCMCMGHPTTKLAHPLNRHFTKVKSNLRVALASLQGDLSLMSFFVFNDNQLSQTLPVEVTTDSTSRTFSINAINFTLSSGEACNEVEANQVESEQTLLLIKQSPTQLHQSYDALVIQNHEFVQSVSTWEAKYQASTAREKDLEEKVHYLETLERHHLTNKVQVQKDNNTALEIFVANTNKVIKAHFPVLRSSLVLLIQVTMGPFDLRHMNFKCL
ncbi:hypothetical protein PVK06_011236 [Gossypium arboreum]|uniref:Uncharacterized protein n=1 Tax=Gossypium arboreum TaxID=29729 RepID=A0ABR0Q8F0_GOSAR|nr:hypothetical protein PVK06_011236 [Gossypium arboreum]